MSLLFLSTGLLFAQSVDKLPTKAELALLENQNESLNIRRTALLAKNDSLTTSIQRLKKEKSLNIFQRQQLEQLLKKSQANDQQLVLLDQEIGQHDLLYQEKLKILVDWYEGQIDSLLSDQKSKSKKISKFLFEKIVALKTERNFYAKKMRPLLIQKLPEGAITIEEFDSYQKIKQKADLIKDQEEKINRQKALLSQQLAQLENELKLRSRMNELISDTYLMDYQTETATQLALSATENNEKSATNYPSWLENDEIRSYALSQPSSSLDVSEKLILETNVSEIATIDLEHFIQRLQLMNRQLEKSADSLRTKALLFYQAAEKKKSETEK